MFQKPKNILKTRYFDIIIIPEERLNRHEDEWAECESERKREENLNSKNEAVQRK